MRARARNVFMHPAALCAAAATGFAQIHVLLAWVHDAQPRRLVGFWALQSARIAPFWPSFLAAPPYDYAFVSNPVVDPDFTDDVIAGVLRCDRATSRAAERDPAAAISTASSETYPAIDERARRARRPDAEAVRARAAVPVSEDFGAASAPAPRARSCGRTGTGSARSARSISRTSATRDGRARRVRDLSRDGSAQLEGRARHRAAVRRGGRGLRAAR